MSFGSVGSSSLGKGFAQFGNRGNGSRDGPSPRSSSTNLQGPSNQHLSTLPESPTSPNSSTQNPGISASGKTNGTQMTENRFGSANPYGNLPDLTDVQPPPGPPPGYGSRNVQPEAEAQKDSEGYTVRPTTSYPISQAEQDAADEVRDQHIKLAIQEQPIKEEDDDAQAALSNVANTLRETSTLTPPNRAMTVRGRRDVRKSVYIAPGATNTDALNSSAHGAIPPSPSLSGGVGTPQPSDLSHISDARSIRSTRSAVAMPVFKHPDMNRPGLNASIVEMATNTFENGQHTGCVVRGEVAFAFHPDLAALASGKQSRLQLRVILLI